MARISEHAKVRHCCLVGGKQSTRQITAAAVSDANQGRALSSLQMEACKTEMLPASLIA